MNVAQREHLRPRRRLGQNFLRDDNIARKIVLAIDPQPDDTILEIGPGEGALTQHLVGTVRRLIVVDIDERVIRRMRETYRSGELEVLHGDFLKTDLRELASRAAGRSRIRIVGNIPYNITSPIVFHVLDSRPHIRDCTLMMQKEVARRLVAVPGSKDYGIPSVALQLVADVEILFDVSPNAFFPRPTVISSLVRMALHREPRFRVANEEFFRSMIRSIFGKRRKTLRASLRYFLPNAEDLVPPETDLMRRPEELSVKELVTLGNMLFERGGPA
jgi:16S rRNA (adenine1518-N6/adenine1519-N6)-dimethyltransferase